MSAPSTRGQRGGSGAARGARAAPFTATRSRDSNQGSTKSVSPARGRGRGRAGATAASTSGDGLLQKLRAGTVKRGSDNTTSSSSSGRGRSASTTAPFTPNSRGRGRGRGRGHLSQTFITPKSPAPTPEPRRSSPTPSNHRDFMNNAFAKFQVLKPKREEERAKAIRDGFLADPEKKTSLDKAITPVGTCTDMCPEFERVERIVQNMVDRAEKVHNEDTGKDIPSEDRMVKRFRRSAAGYDEQLPSDIRTPATLKKTLDYLLDKVVGGGERLATIHKFVWDRTRGIRNDFSIQQVTNVNDVEIAVDCYERIARFHILSLHQLSNPDNLWEGENFDAHQEREQLNNTLLSLLYYYDDNRQRMDFPNEGEFRAYCVIFELQSQHPDLEDRMQSWPSNLLQDKRVQTALRLYTAAGNTLFDQGPLRPMEPFAIAQSNTGSFWNILSSLAVPYIMACVAEIYFGHVRFAALDALWRSCKSAPAAQQAKSRDWSLSEVTSFLGFDTEDETKDFCAAFNLYFSTDEHGDEYLNATANSAHSLDQSSIPNQQLFSHHYVEKKRFRRTLPAVINGVTVAEAIRQGWVEGDEEEEASEEDAREDDQSMFIPESKPNFASTNTSVFGSPLNPQASPFTPQFGSSGFGGFGSSPSTFGKSTSTQQQPESPFKPEGVTQPPKVQQQDSFGSGGFEIPPKEPKFNSTNTTEPTAFRAAELIQTNDSISPTPTTTTASFKGFNLGKPLSASATTAPNTTASSAQSAPSIFGPHPVLEPAFPALSGPSEESSTKANTSSPAPFKFPSFTPPSSRPVNPPDIPTRTQTSEIPPTSSQLPSAPTFSFTQARPPRSSLTESTTAPKSQPSPTNTTSGFSFNRTPNTLADSLGPRFFTTKPSSIPETKQRPSEAFKCPPAPLPTGSSANQGPAEQPLTGPEPTTDLFVDINPSTAAPQAAPQISTTPPHSPVRPPSNPVFTEADRSKLAGNLARAALLRPHGLLQNYVEYTLPDLVRTALNQHRLEVFDAAVASIRQRILARKFGYLWRTRAWRNKLNRRAKNRRQLFAEATRVEQARKKRGEEELEAILHAAEETKRLQREVKQATQAQILRDSTQNNNSTGRIAGQKRKSFSRPNAKESAISKNGTSTSVGHKRSRTTSTFPEPPTSVRSDENAVSAWQTSTSRPQHVSIFSGASVLGRSTSNQDLRRAARKVDTTHTDYFRLKALGVDPEAPIVPYTKESLAMRKLREAEERQTAIARAKKRISHLASDQSPRALAWSPALSIPDAPNPVSKDSPGKMASQPQGEDDFLKQIREAREAMAEQTEWFKQQTVTIEKEIEREEELFRRSQTDQSISPSASGLARANGYEYYPGETKSGLSLSRTERRIRQTGAHGLAVRPLRSRSECVPVAMSKRSALCYSRGSNLSSEQGFGSSPGRKRSRDEMDPAFTNERRDQDTNNIHTSKRPRPPTSSSAPGGIRREKPKAAPHKNGQNSYQLLQSVSYEDTDADDDDVEESDEEQELYDEDESAEHHQPYGTQNGADPDGEEEELEEEEDDDEEAEEELEEEYEEEDPGQYHRFGSGYPDDAATPTTNPQLSRATSSAPGGSMDDALVLSDSDGD
ncbi:uncharacterized protein Z518_01040 [Rhinocladiella mackenziei CBS 650.93]|uniref:SAC3/GANP/THP3 conserved domain-containing protein n=1 Tax=Rhinocladiella mackenziei CBS 650.93 TaxID=1442369 RepID=A0A0D2IV63_9EURO|nr:uncharacterized protein Z518_01040 [Rhinocladiella mackenziei CBS 650.93]KIX09959.1 hypothetical protein Z518_01040 [Rhinocladiella mackenziei CBS 650.93]